MSMWSWYAIAVACGLIIGIESWAWMRHGTSAIVLLVDLAVLEPTSWGTAVALTVLVLIAVAWMAATIIGLLRGQAWTRASATVWQVMQFAIGLGAIQGPTAQPAWGWPIIIVSTTPISIRPI